MSSFTYTISSYDNILGNAVANNVKIVTSGFPTQYKYFKCQVVNFIINYGSLSTALWRTGSYVMLLWNNALGIQNITSGSRVPQIIATANLIDGTMRNQNGSFIISNPNNQTLSFTLVDEAFAITDTVINLNGVNTCWTLTLELTPIDNDPTNQSLRYGL